MSEADFFRVYSGLPRQGPGSEAGTRRAISLLPSLPANPRILDLGCGSGAQSRLLAKELGGRITAIDLHQPFLYQLAGADEPKNGGCPSARPASPCPLLVFNCRAFHPMGDNCYCCKHLWFKRKAHWRRLKPPFLG